MKGPRKVKKAVFHTGVEVPAVKPPGNVVVNSMVYDDPKTGCQLFEHPHGVKAVTKQGEEIVLPVGSVVKQYVLMPKEKDDE